MPPRPQKRGFFHSVFRLFSKPRSGPNAAEREAMTRQEMQIHDAREAAEKMQGNRDRQNAHKNKIESVMKSLEKDFAEVSASIFFDPQTRKFSQEREQQFHQMLGQLSEKGMTVNQMVLLARDAVNPKRIANVKSALSKRDLPKEKRQRLNQVLDPLGFLQKASQSKPEVLQRFTMMIGNYFSRQSILREK